MARSVVLVFLLIAQQCIVIDCDIYDYDYDRGTSNDMERIYSSVQTLSAIIEDMNNTCSNMHSEIDSMYANEISAIMELSLENRLKLTMLLQTNERLVKLFESMNAHEELKGNREEFKKKAKGATCKELLDSGAKQSGVYEIYSGGRSLPLTVFCDMDTVGGGGWTVIQMREDGSEDFNRDWKDYRFGFGHIEGEFWLGNEYIHLLTKDKWFNLLIKMEDFEGTKLYALYTKFRLDSNKNNFRLRLDSYVNDGGTAGNSMIKHSNQPFSTWDRDNDDVDDASCADTFGGGWWFKDCHDSNLNGEYLGGEHGSPGKGVIWFDFHQKNNYSLKMTEMKIREE